MSGLYNILFNVNPLAGTLLAIIGVDHNTVARFRDCFLNEDGTEIIVYTRTGGGNRAEYHADNDKLGSYPGFQGDEDDEFDSTYALFRFRIPEELRERCKELAPLYGVNPAKRWKDAIEAMGRKE